MSRLGRKPIMVPDNVKVSISGQTLAVEGPAGKMSRLCPSQVTVRHDAAAKKIFVECKGTDKVSKSLWGTTRSHVNGMVLGVHQAYEKQMEITGVGYNAKVQGKQLVLQLGYSHPIAHDIPAGLTVQCPTQTLISVKGADKHLVGAFSAVVRASREVEPYNLKGIKYKTEVVKKKAGKTFVSGGQS